MSNSAGEGLMSAIMALTAPPVFGKGEKSGSKKPRAQPKEVFCEGCGDVGDFMLNCTDCGISYHPVCDDPPLDETQVKELVWQCRSCRNKRIPYVGRGDRFQLSDLPQGDDGDDSVATDYDNGKGSESESEEEVKMSKQKKEKNEEKQEGIAARSTEPNAKDKVEIKIETVSKSKRGGIIAKKKKGQSKKKAEKLKNLFTCTIANARTINPGLFEMPRNYQLNGYNFPGSSRSLVQKPVGSKIMPVIVDLEHFCVPRPLALCFKCGKSCRTAMLLQCDYCPHFFHFDCLTPPLTTPPVGLWICPLHPEPLLEKLLLKSTRLSERVKLWDMTHQRVDRTSVVLDFFKKCARRDPPFARKIPYPSLLPYTLNPADGNVIESVKSDPEYQIPFMDKGKLNQFADSESSRKMYKCYEDSFQGFSNPSDAFHEYYLHAKEHNSVISSIPTAKQWVEEIELASKPKEEFKKPMGLPPWHIKPSSMTTASSTVTSSSLVKGKSSKDSKISSKVSSRDFKLPFKDPKISSKGLREDSNDLKKVSSKDSKETFKDSDVSSKEASKDFKESSSLEGIESLLQAAQLLDISPSSLKKQTFNDYKEQNGPSRELANGHLNTTHSSNQCPIDPESMLEIFFIDQGQIAYFYRPNIFIGTGPCDTSTMTHVNPAELANCKRFSEYHAILFYDKSHDQWEILNYSKHGLSVDRIRYVLKPNVRPSSHTSTLEDCKNEILAKRKILYQKQSNGQRTTKKAPVCECLASEVDRCIKVCDNEGSAILYPNSEIQIGCLRMVVRKSMGRVWEFGEATPDESYFEQDDMDIDTESPAD